MRYNPTFPCGRPLKDSATPYCEPCDIGICSYAIKQYEIHESMENVSIRQLNIKRLAEVAR